MTPRAFPRPRVALPVALALTLAVLAVAIWVRTDPASPPFQGLDDAWLRLMSGPHDGPLWTIAEAFNRSGARVGVTATVLFGLLLVALRRWWSALFAVTAVAATYLLGSALKFVGDRPRPADPLIDVGSAAFPSGHAARMASIVLVLTVIVIPVAARRWWWPLAALLVGTMMWSRTWQHAHWLTDTVGGAAFGFGLSMLCWWAFDPLLRRERERREAADVARTRDVRSGSSALP